MNGKQGSLENRDAPFCRRDGGLFSSREFGGLRRTVGTASAVLWRRTVTPFGRDCREPRLERVSERCEAHLRLDLLLYSVLGGSVFRSSVQLSLSVCPKLALRLRVGVQRNPATFCLLDG